MGSLRIALAQVNATVGDIGGNVRLIAGAIERAREKEADLVVFPELAVSGCPPEGLLLEPDFLADCRRALEEITPLAKDTAVLVGFPEGKHDLVMNSAAFMTEGESYRSYVKQRLSRRGECDEGRYFVTHKDAYTFEMNDVECRFTISDDISTEDEEFAYHTGESAVVINLAADRFHAGMFPERRETLAAFAKRTGTFVCYCNLVGGQDELVFDGGSMILSPHGELVAEAARFEEDLLVADITVDLASECRPVAARETEELDRLGEIRRALVLGTRDYAGKNGFSSAVIGLSGGLDSSVVAALAVEALGKDSVVGVTMPSRYNTQETITDAGRLAENLGLRFLTIPIEPAFRAFEKTLAPVLAEGDPGGGSGVTMENLQARVRGDILMALSNRFGWLVLATGNRSEASVGYCTLYGDTVGGFAPIKHVPKTLVYELAARVNKGAGREIIPRSVIERPPSAELKDGQKDQDALPPYGVLDHVIEAYLERHEAAGEIAGQGFDEALVRNVARMVHRGEFKRRQSPPGVMITPPMSGGRGRLPITSRYR